jgi:F-type H+-transporting ATPase subunit delta
MSQSTVARRYANALYEEADDSGVLEDVDDDVLMLRESLESNGELSRFFKSPVISKEKKEAVIQSLLDDRVDELLVRFLRLLVHKDRETMTKEVLDAYQSLRDEQRGIINAHVTVAHPISEEDRDALTETLEEQTGKSVRLHLQEDPELVGGVVIRIGDHVFDGSVRNKLSNLHDRLRRSSLSLETDGSAA